ncbi:hypothetical protein [Reinekea sp. G2M2-21]|uniref:hypothetical protein n=1 Tax=Reinekea sp. G2M2-21 TaxID=2788942 RepID=UPI0018AB4F5B|nr:hypothetical protein [Reinekea sp. G2M2-21]
MKSLPVILLSVFVAPISSCAEEKYQGLFIHYEGMEYEQTLIVCKTGEVYQLKSSPVTDGLLERYHALSKNEYGEVLAVFSGVVEPEDFEKYPNSHYQGYIDITDILHFSSNQTEIDSCYEVMPN